MSRFLLFLLLLCAPLVTSAQSDFNQFFAKFKSAVLRNDKPAVKSMMSSRFEWALDGHVSRDEAWKDLNRYRSTWAGLKQAVSRKPAVCRSPYCNNRPGFHTWSGRRYRLEIMFEKIGGQWKWSALLGD